MGPLIPNYETRLCSQSQRAPLLGLPRPHQNTSSQYHIITSLFAELQCLRLFITFLGSIHLAKTHHYLNTSSHPSSQNCIAFICSPRYRISHDRTKIHHHTNLITGHDAASLSSHHWLSSTPQSIEADHGVTTCVFGHKEELISVTQCIAARFIITGD